MNTEAALDQANLYIELGQYTYAEAIIRDILACAPSQAAAHNGLSHLLFLRGALDDALIEAKFALAIDPSLILAYQNLGYLFADLQQFDNSIRAFSDGLALELANSRLHAGIGLVYNFLESKQAARHHLQMASTLDPEYISPRIALAYQALQQRREDEYLDHLLVIAPLMHTQKPFIQARHAAILGDTSAVFDILTEVVQHTAGYRATIAVTGEFKHLLHTRQLQALLHSL